MKFEKYNTAIKIITAQLLKQEFDKKNLSNA